MTNKLGEMLDASCDDLIDGFACKAVIKTLTSQGNIAFKLNQLNELLTSKNIIVLNTEHELELLDGFKEVGLAGAITHANGDIEIKVTDIFFDDTISPSILKRALRFQSLVAHELVHREQFQTKPVYGITVRTDEESSNTEYLNDLQEIEAMAAEISHDMQAKHLLGGAQMFDISPRLKALMENARLLGETTLLSLQKNMKIYT